MDQIRLRVLADDNQPISCIRIEDGQLRFSADTDPLFIDAVNYLIANRSVIEYRDDDNRLVTAVVPEDPSEFLKLLADYLRHSMRYQTKLEPEISVNRVVDSVWRSTVRRATGLRNAPSDAQQWIRYSPQDEPCAVLARAA